MQNDRTAKPLSIGPSEHEYGTEKSGARLKTVINHTHRYWLEARALGGAIPKTPHNLVQTRRKLSFLSSNSLFCYQIIKSNLSIKLVIPCCSVTKVAPPRASQGPASLLDTKFGGFWPGKGSFLLYWPLKLPETVRFGTARWDGAT